MSKSYCISDGCQKNKESGHNVLASELQEQRENQDFNTRVFETAAMEMVTKGVATWQIAKMLAPARKQQRGAMKPRRKGQPSKQAWRPPETAASVLPHCET